MAVVKRFDEVTTSGIISISIYKSCPGTIVEVDASSLEPSFELFNDLN